MTRILLVKLAALGDVLRTTCLLPGIRKKWPAAEVTWIICENARPLLARNREISKILSIESESCSERNLRADRWDVLINLDEDPRATALAALIPAAKKYGIGRNAGGRLIPLSIAAEHLVRLAADDRLKFRENQQPFQALVYRAVGLEWSGESYQYEPPADLNSRTRKLSETLTISDTKRIGIFVGASDRYANKFWSESEIADFCSRYKSEKQTSGSTLSKTSLVLFGGPAERDRLDRLRSRTPGGEFLCLPIDSLDDLAALAAACHVLICGDTLAMHLGLAMGVPLISLFGPTAHAEIPGASRKIISPYSCGPCYLRICDIVPSCMTAITAGRVLDAVKVVLDSRFRGNDEGGLNSYK